MRRRLGMLGAGLAAISALAFACSDDVKTLSGEGGPCELLGDCESGLVCMPTGGAGRACRRVIAVEPTPPIDSSTDAPRDALSPADATSDASTDASDASSGSDAADANPTDAADAADASEGG